MHSEVQAILKEIRSLKIQGARNVARMSLKALGLAAKNSKAQSSELFYNELRGVAGLLSSARPTEPMTRNMIEDVCRFTLLQLRTRRAKNIEELKQSLVEREDALLKKMDEDAKQLALYGAQLIPNDSIVLTHCHSSTVTRIFKEAKRIRKRFSVVCFETRPRYQGRVTARELIATGIDTTLAIDGAMALFMKKADIVIVGADAITSRGDLINKIGTSTLAHIAHMNDVSFYSAAELYKYNPATLKGKREKIEERDFREIWESPPKKLKIKNPAFEATAARYINGYITELGVVPSQSLFTIASEKLGIKIVDD